MLGIKDFLRLMIYGRVPKDHAVQHKIDIVKAKDLGDYKPHGGKRKEPWKPKAVEYSAPAWKKRKRKIAQASRRHNRRKAKGMRPL